MWWWHFLEKYFPMISFLAGCIGFFYVGKYYEYIRIYNEMEKKYSDEILLPLIQKHIPGANVKTYHIEQLKNALLSYALNTIKINDPNFKPFSDFRMDYENFDGTQLPMFSGCDITNACFTYIKQCEETNLYMEDKQIAIQKYLIKNLNTSEQIVNFFNKFVELTKIKEEDREINNRIRKLINEDKEKQKINEKCVNETS